MASQLAGREGHPFKTPINHDSEDYFSLNDNRMHIASSLEYSKGDPEAPKVEDRNRTEDEQSPAFDIQAQPTNGLVLGGGQSIKLMLVPDKAFAPATPPVKKEKPHPQTKMQKFWANFDPEYVGKVTRILPDRMTDDDVSAAILVGETGHRAAQSYENARESCIRDVKWIIKECRDSNQKYTDSHWDIERDLKITRIRDCLDGLLIEDEDKEHPADAKRVTVSVSSRQLSVCSRKLCRTFLKIQSSMSMASRTTIFCKAQQGRWCMLNEKQPSADKYLRDCWFLAAISSLSCNQEFIDRVCVIQDQAVGVYGFVFHRGESFLPVPKASRI